MLKNQELIKKMTLEEKASLLSGENFWNTKAIDRLSIPSIMLTDGPHGVRKQGGKADHLGLNKSIPATCFPTAATLANSWDIDLLEQVGVALANECLNEDVSVILGPGLNIKRNPLCGRNFEYFSEDPFLTGKLVASMIKGIESKGVSACPKHFAVNSQEHMRMSINEIVDERALRELYLEGFRYAIKEGKPGTLMTSYNKVNGQYANENTHLLQDLLQDEWQYDGVVVTDWGGNNSRLDGLIAGNHLEMPSTGGVTDREIVESIKSGRLSLSLLDERIDVLLTWLHKYNRSKFEKLELDYKKQHQIAVESAKQSLVLLKNEKQILPLNRNLSYSVIGDFAHTPRYQGAGSSLIEPTFLDNALDALKHKQLNIVGSSKGFNRFGGKNHKLVNESIQLAKQSDAVILFLGLDEGSETEGIDRDSMSLRKEQLTLIQEIVKVNQNLIVVLSGGSPVEIPFDADVCAILHSYLGGQGSGEAVASLLVGEMSPCGKLAESYPVQYSDVPSKNYYPGGENTSEHRESLYIGYRYYEKANVSVRYPFGHGLTYTTFEYSDLKVRDHEVEFKITNTGHVLASEIAQVYIGLENSAVFRSVKELKGFKKVALQPGETKTLTIPLDEHAFKFYSTFENRWATESGTYDIMIGASSKDIRLKDKWVVAGDALFNESHHSTSVSKYFEGNIQNLTKEDFEALLEREIPPSSWDHSKDLDQNDTFRQAGYKSWVGKTIVGLLELTRKILWLLKRPIAANYVYFVMNMPFRQMHRFSKGKISEKRVNRYLMVINKGLIRGLLGKIN